jgi:uncharacterized protein
MYKCAYHDIVNYSWDPKKASANLGKHGIDFADAVSIFSDDYAVTIEDSYPGERRFITMGRDLLGRISVVVYTWRGETIRIISARKATMIERRKYEETI